MRRMEVSSDGVVMRRAVDTDEDAERRFSRGYAR